MVNVSWKNWDLKNLDATFGIMENVSDAQKDGILLKKEFVFQSVITVIPGMIKGNVKVAIKDMLLLEENVLLIQMHLFQV